MSTLGIAFLVCVGFIAGAVCTAVFLVNTMSVVIEKTFAKADELAGVPHKSREEAGLP